MPEISGRDQAGRFRAGASGNPAGRPKGCRDRATRLAEELFDGAAESLARKALVMALKGDTTALRLCLERVLPPRRERPVQVDLPPVETAADAVRALGAILGEVAGGRLLPGEAVELAKLIDSFTRTLEIRELEQRIAALEARA